MNNTLPLKDKFVGALVGTHAGDALGMPVEGFSIDKIRGSFRKIEGFINSRLGIGTYTDDTQMTIGVAESLIDSRDFDGEDMSWRFIRNFEITRGYGPGTIQTLIRIRKGTGWDNASKAVFPEGSYGNGSSKRIAPIGLLYGENTAVLIEQARKASIITHSHPLSINGAQLQAFAIAKALRLDPSENVETNRQSFLTDLTDFSNSLANPYPERMDIICDFLNGNPSEEEIITKLGNNEVSVNSVPTALYCSLRHLDDFREGVLMAVNLGGDTDTIGAMTGAILGASNGINSIPAEWLDNLENGEKGRDYIIALAKRLFELYNEKLTNESI
ncbi:MAG: ADP-ribosylglycohydrolase family protein [Candidatus Thermoplasmatota archaeon]|nr:ADP-ribosylglycohydrolase family protein [Candidatus Thermoplasmatota archaeon]